jgi:transcriptional regulator with XRE-family HTH domain
MDNKSEVRDFLTTRRARVTPEQVELPGGPGRRVPGLRRTEVAMLAGVSVEYYSRLERGDLGGVSETVLEAIGSALGDLARAANESPVRSRSRARSRPSGISRALQLALDSVTAGPAFVRNGRMDVLGENALFRALYSDLYALPERPVNLARFVFLHRELAEAFYPSWSIAADINVAILRTEAGRDPHDKALHDLVGELSTRSDEFRARWGAHEVRHHASGNKSFRHPVVGDLELVYEAMEPMGQQGLNFLIYSAEPGSPTEERLRLLASWGATPASQEVRETGLAGRHPRNDGARREDTPR